MSGFVFFVDLSLRHNSQVQFDEREDTKVCTIIVNDDKVFEGVESFHVELSMPVYALLGGNTRAVVNINDTEDEPKLQFDKKTYHVNESTGLVHIPIERKGIVVTRVSPDSPVVRCTPVRSEHLNVFPSQATPPAPCRPSATPRPGRLRAAASTLSSPAPITRAAA